MKKHKKHKGDRKERYEDNDKPHLKLILKVGGNSSTPEHSDSPGPPPGGSLMGSNYMEDESSTSLLGVPPDMSGEFRHKKAKKKKKKKDRDREKHEKKHKHHHKEKKKRMREESSQDDISFGEESSEIPMKKAAVMSDIPTTVEALSPAILHQNIVSPRSVEGPASPYREPRTCVLRQRQEHTPLLKLLEYLLKNLEKKDPQNFFAWPVTDKIAPGYSSIISHPMDFSTIRQKNDDNLYKSLPEFMEDFKLMCENAMLYNQQDTVYYRTAKKLLHAGLKLCSREKLRTYIPSMIFLSELTKQELGFELQSPEEIQRMNEAAALASVISAKQSDDNDTATETPMIIDAEDELTNDMDKIAAVDEAKKEAKRKIRIQNQPSTKFEAIPDDMSPEEVLAQVQDAARSAAETLAVKKPYSKMGFLRTNKDGSTSLAIICGSTGIIPGTNEQAISLGALAGKLPHGTGQLAGFREDKRNMAKTVKPLYYGSFGSYAPSYDSTFANLTKEETDIVYSTYGDESGVQYAESLMDFARDSDYTIRMVDELLDILTGGEHSKTISQITSLKRKKPSESSSGNKPSDLKREDNKVVVDAVDLNKLKNNISDLGFETDFLTGITQQQQSLLTTEAVQASLDQTSQLIGQLQKVQRDRLSQPLPPHLALLPGPSESEVQLAEKITDNLTDLAKQVTPEAIAPVTAVRKAMGVDITIAPPHSNKSKINGGKEKPNCIDLPDLESELREFLESTEPTLTSSPLHDEDRTIEDILSES